MEDIQINFVKEFHPPKNLIPHT